LIFMKKPNNWKIVRRTFKAFQHPRGSPERNRLNRSSITSEFARKNKYLVVDSSNKPLKSFRTYTECTDFIKNPNKFKPVRKIKKYTMSDFIKGRDWYIQRRNALKFG